MRHKLFKEAEVRMVTEFIDAGHTSLADPTPDDLHPLHGLFLDTQSVLEQYCRGSRYEHHRWILKGYRAHLQTRLLKPKDRLDKAEHEGFEVSFRNGLPSNAELLALRFATQKESDNADIVELLTKLDMLHLWHISPHTEIEIGAKLSETKDDADDSSTAGAPTEGDSSLEVALKVELASADRKIKAIQDAKRDLKSKLAMVKEAETAVLQARDAMTRTQNAIANADIALLQSPLSFLAEDC